MPLITPRLGPLLQPTLAMLVACGILTHVGCQRRLDPEEYGEVLDTLPRVEGAEKPWPLPELQGQDQVPKKLEKLLK